MKWPFRKDKDQKEEEQIVKSTPVIGKIQEMSEIGALKKRIKELEPLEKRVRELELKISSMSKENVTWTQFIIWIVIMGIAMAVLEILL